jgi:hypothetical protein
LPPAFTNTNGDFVLANVPSGTYTIQVTIEGFKTLKRTGIEVNAGDRVGLGSFTIQIGALAETVTVVAETPLVQTPSGERSFAVSTQSVESLPIANRTATPTSSTATRR